MIWLLNGAKLQQYVELCAINCLTEWSLRYQYLYNIFPQLQETTTNTLTQLIRVHLSNSRPVLDYWFIVTMNQMRGLEQRRRAPERAPRPSGHRSGTSCAHISPRYAGRSIIGNKEKIIQLLPISTCYGWLLLITTYYWPTWKGVYSPIDLPEKGSTAPGCRPLFG